MAPKTLQEGFGSHFGIQFNAKMDPETSFLSMFGYSVGLNFSNFLALDLSILHPAETLFTPFSLQASKNPAAHWPHRCEISPRSTQWSFKLREAKL